MRPTLRSSTTSSRGLVGLPTVLLTALTLLLPALPALGAPKADPWPRWQTHDDTNTSIVDHKPWGKLLSTYLSADDSGVHRFAYGSVSPADKARLKSYIVQLQATPISLHNRKEQLAYWINLYNALTIQVILDHYPVESIRDIDISSGVFSGGPWGAKLAKVEGQELTLNDIEHRILRPIWKDNRIHYAVNCASIGCPNLASEPYTSKNADRLLKQGARDFVNHPRGARFEDRRLIVSNIYLWYQSDFGDSDQGLVAHLREYAEGELADKLEEFNGRLSGDYDWDLNEP